MPQIHKKLSFLEAIGAVLRKIVLRHGMQNNLLGGSNRDLDATLGRLFAEITRFAGRSVENLSNLENQQVRNGRSPASILEIHKILCIDPQCIGLARL